MIVLKKDRHKLYECSVWAMHVGEGTNRVFAKPDPFCTLCIECK